MELQSNINKNYYHLKHVLNHRNVIYYKTIYKNNKAYMVYKEVNGNDVLLTVYAVNVTNEIKDNKTDVIFQDISLSTGCTRKEIKKTINYLIKEIDKRLDIK